MEFKLEKPFTTAIIGATKTGKTFFTKKLLQQQLLEQFDYIVILSPTASLSRDWDEPWLRPNDDIKQGRVVQLFEKDWADVIHEVISSQERLLRNYPRKKVSDVLLLIDDCAGARILDRGQLLDKISVSTRHYKISLLILVQKVSAIPYTLRVNTAYIVLFNSTNFLELQKFIEQFCPKRMQKALSAHIEEIYDVPYNFIFANNRSTKISERLYKNGDLGENLYHQLVVLD